MSENNICIQLQYNKSEIICVETYDEKYIELDCIKGVFPGAKGLFVIHGDSQRK